MCHCVISLFWTSRTCSFAYTSRGFLEWFCPYRPPSYLGHILYQRPLRSETSSSFERYHPKISFRHCDSRSSSQFFSNLSSIKFSKGTRRPPSHNHHYFGHHYYRTLLVACSYPLRSLLRKC